MFLGGIRKGSGGNSRTGVRLSTGTFLWGRDRLREEIVSQGKTTGNRGSVFTSEVLYDWRNQKIYVEERGHETQEWEGVPRCLPTPGDFA